MEQLLLGLHATEEQINSPFLAHPRSRFGLCGGGRRRRRGYQEAQRCTASGMTNTSLDSAVLSQHMAVQQTHDGMHVTVA